LNKDQIGQFDVSRELIYGNPDLVARIFSEMKLVVISAETLYHSDSIRYTAISEKFRALIDSFDIPEYSISASEENGIFSISVREL